MGSLYEVLHKHLSRYCDNKCGIVGTILNFVIGVDDFLDAGN
jgi:hypothetical protein